MKWNPNLPVDMQTKRRKKKKKPDGPKYPDVQVQLSERDGNAFMMIGAVRKALKRAGVGVVEIDRFSKEAKSGDYDNVLQTCMKWVDVV